MIETHRSDDIGDFVDFLKRFPESQSALQQAVGASRERVEQFERLSRYPLPALYRGYLSMFGMNDRGLDLADDGNSNVNNLIEFYEEQVPVGFWGVPFLGTVIALPGLTGGRALLYEEELNEEPQVAINWGEHVSTVISASARNWMYQTAYARFRFRSDNASRLFESLLIPGDGSALLPHICDSLGEQRFTSYWFSDAYAHSAENHDLCVHAIASPSNVSLMMAGSKRACLDLVANLRQRFGALQFARAAPLAT